MIGAAPASFTDRSGGSPVDASGRLIVALDVPTVAEAREIVCALDGIVTFYKIGLHLQWDSGVQPFIRELLGTGRRVFVDYKYADIGATMRGGVAGASRIGATFLTIQGSGEATDQAIRAALEGRGDSVHPKLLLVTVLTSVDDADVEALGRHRTVADLAVERASRAVNAGLDGVVASGREAAAIRAVAPESFIIITPGVRPASAAGDDQKRIVTPAAAVAAGADYLVVGRPVIAWNDRRAAAEAIIAEMRSAFEAR